MIHEPFHNTWYNEDTTSKFLRTHRSKMFLGVNRVQWFIEQKIKLNLILFERRTTIFQNPHVSYLVPSCTFLWELNQISNSWNVLFISLLLLIFCLSATPRNRVCQSGISEISILIFFFWLFWEHPFRFSFLFQNTLTIPASQPILKRPHCYMRWTRHRQKLPYKSSCQKNKYSIYFYYLDVEAFHLYKFLIKNYFTL